MMKTILGRYGNTHRHWVGDGFPVRTLFSYGSLGDQISPFLLLDYAGPMSLLRRPSSAASGRTRTAASRP